MVILLSNDPSDIDNWTQLVELSEKIIAEHDDKIRTNSHNIDDYLSIIRAFKEATTFNRRLLDTITVMEEKS